MGQSVPDLPTRAATVLLSCSALEGDDAATCADLLEPKLDAGSILWVTYTRSPGACVRSLVDRHPDPVRGVVLTVGEPRQGVAEVPDGVSVETVENPTDLTGLGIAIREQLESPPEGSLALCFDSVTALLQYVDLETAYEFLHVLAGQVVAADAWAHYHVDPRAHDEQTLATLTSLTDGAIEVDANGTTIRTRFDP